MATGPREPATAQPLGAGVVVFLVVAGAVGVVLGGAQLAARLGRGRWLGADLGDAASAALGLWAERGDPRLAWSPELRAGLPGAATYWGCTAAAALIAGGVVAVGLRLRSPRRVGTEPRRRLGVETGARLARARDVAPLVVRRAQEGRFVLGRVGRHLVATERRSGGRARRRGGRQGDRSAVCVIGPTRCGKTANTISGILEWKGPAVLSSVKTDLLEATMRRRAELGEVKIFDPAATTGRPTASWSPLWAAGSVAGAQEAAALLKAARARVGERSENSEFFAGRAAQLLWAFLYAAKVSNRSMLDVVRWVMTFDCPSGEHRGEPGTVLDRQLASGGGEALAGARAALMALGSISGLDERTRSGVFGSAQPMVEAWQDPHVASSAEDPTITLDWLVQDANTLYICAPARAPDRVAIVLGALVSDLIGHAYDWQGRRGRRLPDTLMVLDEAANTPTQWLPEVVSTCSGIGIQLVTVWQSKAQIDAAYGRLADSVLTNHGTKLFFSGVSDPATLEYASRLVGNEEVVHRSVATDVGWGRRNVTEATAQLPLVAPDVLRQVPTFEALLVHGMLRPAHLRARPYYAERALRRMSDRPTAERREQVQGQSGGRRG